MNLGSEYLRIVKKRFQHIKQLGDKTMEQLSEEDIHWRLNQESNNIAMIVKHLSGNMMSRWTDFLESDGEKPYRKRDEEFIDDIPTKMELEKMWEKGWDALFNALDQLKEEELVKQVLIRGESHTAMEAIERQLAHYAYHIGQIVYIGKQIKNEDWSSLSIPRGRSEEYLQQMFQKHQQNSLED